MVISSR